MKKIVIIFIIIGILLLFSSPAFAKEKVKVKITTGDHYDSNTGYIIIKLVDSHGNNIKSDGTIHYRVTDKYGNYDWGYKPYSGKILLKYDNGDYNVKVKFDGDSNYKKVKKTKIVTVDSKGIFDPYNYYDDHNWGLNQRIDDYMEDNYWDEEIYDNPYNYDGEGY